MRSVFNNISRAGVGVVLMVLRYIGTPCLTLSTTECSFFFFLLTAKSRAREKDRDKRCYLLVDGDPKDSINFRKEMANYLTARTWHHMTNILFGDRGVDRVDILGS